MPPRIVRGLAVLIEWVPAFFRNDFLEPPLDIFRRFILTPVFVTLLLKGVSGPKYNKEVDLGPLRLD